MNFGADASEGQARVAAFMQALQKLGWNEGDNVRTEVRWPGDDVERYRKYSEELVGLNPDVILASASQSVAALQRITRSVPIVFANVADPVGAGYVTSLARPGGNATGFTAFVYSIGGKWLELLKQIAPRVTLRDRCVRRDDALKLLDAGVKKIGFRYRRAEIAGIAADERLERTHRG